MGEYPGTHKPTFLEICEEQAAQGNPAAAAFVAKKKHQIPPAVVITDGKELKLYDMIVKRFLASFAEPALKKSVTYTINSKGFDFIAHGKQTIKQGWTKYYDYVLEDDIEQQWNQTGLEPKGVSGITPPIINKDDEVISENEIAEMWNRNEITFNDEIPVEMSQQWNINMMYIPTK